MNYKILFLIFYAFFMGNLYSQNVDNWNEILYSEAPILTLKEDAQYKKSTYNQKIRLLESLLLRRNEEIEKLSDDYKTKDRLRSRFHEEITNEKIYLLYNNNQDVRLYNFLRYVIESKEFVLYKWKSYIFLKLAEMSNDDDKRIKYALLAEKYNNSDNGLSAYGVLIVYDILRFSYFRKNNPDKSRDYSTRSITLSINEIKNRSPRDSQLPLFYYMAGFNMYILGDYKNAKRYLSQALDLGMGEASKYLSIINSREEYIERSKNDSNVNVYHNVNVHHSGYIDTY